MLPGIATDIQIGTALEPCVELRTALAHSLLHVDTLWAIAREGQVELMQVVFRQRPLPLGLV